MTDFEISLREFSFMLVGNLQTSFSSMKVWNQLKKMFIDVLFLLSSRSDEIIEKSPKKKPKEEREAEVSYILPNGRL